PGLSAGPGTRAERPRTGGRGEIHLRFPKIVRGGESKRERELRRLGQLLPVALRVRHVPLRLLIRPHGQGVRMTINPLGGLNSRRRFLKSASCGFGFLALADLCTRSFAAEAGNPLAPKAPHFPARAKHVIFMYMEGAPSHVDTFDY